jgi:uncharacterized protein (DUF2267 family)
MESSAFIGAVATRLGTTPEQARAITTATLTTLAERIDPGEARHLSLRLPGELAAFAFAPNETAERFGLDEFVSRVGGRADTDRTQATQGVRAVFATLRDAVPPTEYDHVVGHLPAEFWDISGTTGRYDISGTAGRYGASGG